MFRFLNTSYFFISINIITLLLIFIISKPGITHDSVMYLNAANTFVENGTFLDFYNNALNMYPLFYPFVLSLNFIFETDSNLGLILVQLILALASMVLFESFSKKIITDSSIRKIYFIFILVSSCLWANYYFVWADSLSISLLFFTLFYYIKKYNHTTTVDWLVIALLSVFSYYTRFIGVVVIPSIIVHYLFVKDDTLKNKIKPIFIYSIVCLLGIFLLLLRNYIMHGNITNPYDKGIYTFTENISSIIKVISGFIVPNSLSDILLYFVGSIVLFIPIILWNKTNHIDKLIFIFQFIYISFFGLLNTVFNICPFDERYLSPIYPTVIYSIVFLVNSIQTTSKIKIIILILFLIYPSLRFLHQIHFHATNSVGFEASSWKNSAIIHILKKYDVNELVIYSDNPLPIYYHTHKTIYIPDKKIEFKNAMLIDWKGDKELNYTEHNPLIFFKKSFNYKTVYTSEEGTIYILTLKK